VMVSCTQNVQHGPGLYASPDYILWARLPFVPLEICQASTMFFDEFSCFAESDQLPFSETQESEDS
jgi:hypothetical protein